MYNVTTSGGFSRFASHCPQHLLKTLQLQSTAASGGDPKSLPLVTSGSVTKSQDLHGAIEDSVRVPRPTVSGVNVPTRNLSNTPLIHLSSVSLGSTGDEGLISADTVRCHTSNDKVRQCYRLRVDFCIMMMFQ